MSVVKLALCCCLVTLGRAVASEEFELTIGQGALKGLKTMTVREGKAFYSFKGIPYAQPNEGVNKFRVSKKSRRTFQNDDGLFGFFGCSFNFHSVCCRILCLRKIGTASWTPRNIDKPAFFIAWFEKTFSAKRIVFSLTFTLPKSTTRLDERLWFISILAVLTLEPVTMICSLPISSSKRTSLSSPWILDSVQSVITPNSLHYRHHKLHRVIKIERASRRSFFFPPKYVIRELFAKRVVPSKKWWPEVEVFKFCYSWIRQT